MHGGRILLAAGHVDVGAGVVDDALGAGDAGDRDDLVIGGVGPAVGAEPGDAVVGRVLGGGRVEAVALEGQDQAAGRAAGLATLTGQGRLGLDRDELRQHVEIQRVGARAARAVDSRGAEDVQGEDLPLGHDGAEPGAGAKQDAGGGVAQLQGQAGPRDVLEQAGDVEDLGAGAAGGLGGCGQGVVGILMPGDNRQRRFDHMDDGTQVAGGLRRVIGWDHGGLAEDDPDAVAIDKRDILRSVAVEITDDQIEGGVRGR